MSDDPETIRCPVCGIESPAGSTHCVNCGRPLPRGSPDRSRTPEQNRQVYWGVGLGMIPVIVFWIALGIGVRSSSSTGNGIAVAGGVLFGLEILAAIVCLIIKRVRHIGYGLLAMVFIGPVIWSIGCIVILSTNA